MSSAEEAHQPVRHEWRDDHESTRSEATSGWLAARGWRSVRGCCCDRRVSRDIHITLSHFLSSELRPALVRGIIERASVSHPNQGLISLSQFLSSELSCSKQVFEISRPHLTISVSFIWAEELFKTSVWDVDSRPRLSQSTGQKVVSPLNQPGFKHLLLLNYFLGQQISLFLDVDSRMVNVVRL
jgi:hypothetical protein